MEVHLARLWVPTVMPLMSPMVTLTQDISMPAPLEVGSTMGSIQVPMVVLTLLLTECMVMAVITRLVMCMGDFSRPRLKPRDTIMLCRRKERGILLIRFMGLLERLRILPLDLLGPESSMF